LIEPFNFTPDIILVQVVVTYDMLHCCAGNHLAGLKQQPITKVTSDSMSNSQSTCEASPTAVDLDLLLVIVPHSIIKLEVEPFRNIWSLASYRFNAGLLLLTTRYPIQDVGLVDRAKIPQMWWHLSLHHAIPPSLLQLANLSLGSVILIRTTCLGAF
jgi:hypothetical protein